MLSRKRELDMLVPGIMKMPEAIERFKGPDGWHSHIVLPDLSVYYIRYDERRSETGLHLLHQTTSSTFDHVRLLLPILRVLPPEISYVFTLWKNRQIIAQEWWGDFSHLNEFYTAYKEDVNKHPFRNNGFCCHRNNAPAFFHIYDNERRVLAWMQDNKGNRENGPAHYEEWEDAYSEQWLMDDDLHRTTGPAYTIWQNGVITKEMWAIEGEELPELDAFIKKHGNENGLLEYQRKFPYLRQYVYQIGRDTKWFSKTTLAAMDFGNIFV